MKIFNEENGQRKVYVQLNDAMMLMHIDGVLCPPREVLEKQFSRVFVVTDSNRYDFAEYTEDETIKYFEKMDWIVDFKTYKDMSEEEILDCACEINDEVNELKRQFNERVKQLDYDKCDELQARIEQLEFKINSLRSLFWNKQGHIQMPFPVVPDSDGFSVANDDCEYVARQGLNPLQVLVYRKDGNPLDEKTDLIPQGLIHASETILIDYNLENNEFFGTFERRRNLSDDSKYLVTTFRIVPEEIKEEEQVKKQDVTRMSLKNKVQNFGKRIKDWYNRKNQ